METTCCPSPDCKNDGSLLKPIANRGFYPRGGRRVQRYHCKYGCPSFSDATFDPCYWQHKRHINKRLQADLCSKMSQNRAAMNFKINVKTVAHRVRFFGMQGREHQRTLRGEVKNLEHVMFDEMQASEHTKAKPVAIPMVTCPKTRRILAVGVASMPAQHPLKEISLKKYGVRKDERPEAIIKVLESIKPMLKPNAILTTDRAPRYLEPIAMVLPEVIHDAHKSRKARSGGQGELKRIVKDPLFNFNHTAAMARDGLSCLVRKTWCNTKMRARLEDRMYMYAHFHNTILIPFKQKSKK